MAKKLTRIAKLQFGAGQAKPGPELAGLGIDMGGFTKQFNDATRERTGEVVPVIITCYSDRTFDFVTKTEPAARRILKAAGLEKGAQNSALETVAKLTKDQVREIAEYKLEDMNANDVEAAMWMIEGTARNMGVVVEGMTPLKDIEGAKKAAKQAAAMAAEADSAAAAVLEDKAAAEIAAENEDDDEDTNEEDAK